MWILDGHLDLAWNALQWNRDLTRTVAELREAPRVEISVLPGVAPHGDITPTVSLPQMREGRVGLCFTTLLARSTGRPVPHMDFPSPLQAHAVANGQLAYYRVLESRGWLKSIRDRRSLDALVLAWEAFDRTGEGAPPPLGYVLAMEGADPILDPAELTAWHAAGLRMLGLSHYGHGRYAGGTGTTEGLSPLGRPMLEAMRRLGVILDVTHLSDPAFSEAMGLWDGPVMASHLNCRSLVPHQRQASDEQLRALIGRGAVIGAVFDAWMLVPGWKRGAETPAVPLSAVADHIDHVCQLAGNARHAAIGSDLDGGFGREQSPEGLDTIADLQRIGELLRARGYADTDVAAILHGNWLGLLRGAWQADGAGAGRPALRPVG